MFEEREERTEALYLSTGTLKVVRKCYVQFVPLQGAYLFDFSLENEETIVVKVDPFGTEKILDIFESGVLAVDSVFRLTILVDSSLELYL